MQSVKGLTILAAIVLSVSGSALADEGHGHSMSGMGEMDKDMPTHKDATGGMEAEDHDHGTETAFGEPGRESEVTRTIHVQATDQLRFVFDRTDIRQGDVVKFIVKNVSHVQHEFILGDAAYQEDHEAMMQQMPGMEHNDPNMLSLKPGETKTLIWKFDKPVKSALIFACHQPGHFAAGMVVKTTLGQ